ncbi:COX15/CtaA family protein [Cellulomonas sp. zg-ZUI222]|uniref:COX15/CtaA family protein n=2 Tax=Cellulomonadaceae TaxID=85016 RepID=A0ABX8D9Q4_9CELL|nr:COX15/CtaA family protein [Cellulomonas sp. zg-ZUI22]MBO0922620.1 COX15/CtaA family protein [Cellulomonas wangleii]MBO0926515.1 COX15/CtaA family protein [Cellulomonas wangleii]QVI64183.1 COX15/CtaA family protein [Cellulomonas wangleii]
MPSPDSTSQREHERPPGSPRRVVALLDRLRPGWTQRAVVANLVAQIGIVVTGGAVRLTGSGLGCSTWPYCEPGRFTPELHAEMTIHPLIEFGNRTLTGVLLVVALAVALLAGLDRTRSLSYRRLAWAPFAGVVVQAGVGGITVLVDLHPAIVGSHFLISAALIAVSAWLLVRRREGDGPVVPVVDERVRTLARGLAVLGAVVVALGVVVTGAGPHSGDEEVGYRFAVDPYAVARVHALSVWAFVVTLAVILVLLARARRVADAGSGGPARALRSGLVLMAVTLAQGLVGYVQLFTGLPIALVNLHMLGAGVLIAAIASFLGTLRRREA